MEIIALNCRWNAEGLIYATEASSSIRANGGRSALFVNGGSPSVPKACLI